MYIYIYILLWIFLKYVCHLWVISWHPVEKFFDVSGVSLLLQAGAVAVHFLNSGFSEHGTSLQAHTRHVSGSDLVNGRGFGWIGISWYPFGYGRVLLASSPIFAALSARSPVALAQLQSGPRSVWSSGARQGLTGLHWPNCSLGFTGTWFDCKYCKAAPVVSALWMCPTSRPGHRSCRIRVFALLFFPYFFFYLLLFYTFVAFCLPSRFPESVPALILKYMLPCFAYIVRSSHTHATPTARISLAGALRGVSGESRMVNRSTGSLSTRIWGRSYQGIAMANPRIRMPKKEDLMVGWP